MVGSQRPTDPLILLKSENFTELFRLTRDPGILKSVGTLNTDDLRTILFAVAMEAGKAAFDDATRDSSLSTPDALRTALLTRIEQAIGSAVADYFLFVPIFGEVKPPPADVQICTWCSLVAAPAARFTDNLQTIYGELVPLNQLGKLLPDKMVAAWRISCTGYLSQGVDCSAMIHGLSRARELLYLGECFDALRESRGLIQAAMTGPSDAGCYAQRADGTGAGQRMSGGGSVIGRAARLLLNPDPIVLVDIVQPGEDELTALHRRLKSRTSRLAPLWNAAADDVNLRRLRSAIEWAFEGERASEPSTSLVESFIALEALLGDEEAESISNGRISDRLADRYAYLVGTTPTERRHRADQFRKLYRVRGRLVHGNQSRAELAHDFASRYEAIVMAQAAITEEAKRYLHAHTQQLARALRARTPSAS